MYRQANRLRKIITRITKPSSEILEYNRYFFRSKSFYQEIRDWERFNLQAKAGPQASLFYFYHDNSPKIGVVGEREVW